MAAADQLRDTLRRVFEIGAHPLALSSQDITQADGHVVEALRFAAADGGQARGVLCRPDGPGPHPAVLVIHAHGNRYDIGARELTEGRPALQGPLGPALARGGIAALCVDLPCFGARSDVTEAAASKAALWRGRSLAGQMLGELSAQLDWLAGRGDIDASRIGVYGISMGATLGYWLAAVDTRVAALAQLCCFADLAALIETGAHDLHGPYLTVPGLLNIAPNGVIAGLVAPRAQLICVGDADPLTPPAALDVALAQVRAGYADAPDALCVLRDADSGHRETAAMRAEVLRFLRAHLAGAGGRGR